MTPSISVENLHKSYGNFEAVGGISFEVQPGEVFGLLGPNGAGKTTTVEILEGLRLRTSGNVKVLGFDPGVDVKALKDRIGVCLQSTNLPEKIKLIEAMTLFSSFYSHTVNADKLLDRLQLTEKRNAFYSVLSGGQKQRLHIALAMINDPQLIFLDEPTTGLDPQIRMEIHGLIQELRDDKRSIVLTTHYIEEAERLCDRVAIIDSGKIIAHGTPKQLMAETLGASIVEIKIEKPLPPGDLPAEIGADRIDISDDRKDIKIASKKPARAMVELVKYVDQLGLELVDIHLKRGTLEDVFLQLTGKKLRE